MQGLGSMVCLPRVLKDQAVRLAQVAQVELARRRKDAHKAHNDNFQWHQREAQDIE
jgi:hypothetical protein